MASIQKTARGFRAQVFVLGVRDSASFRTKREAIAWADSRETEIREGRDKPASEQHTLEEAMKDYSEKVSPTKRGARWEEIRIAALIASPIFPSGELLGKLTPDTFGVWRDARLREVSAGTVLREIGLVSAVLETARREWKWIESNPIREMRKPKSPDHREIIITWKQAKAMLKAMGYQHKGEVRTVAQACAVCFLVALRTGMRAGELCGLTWDRVFDDYCVLPVTKTVPRNVPLTEKAVRLIERMRGYDPLLVFGMRKQSLDANFRKYRDRAGLSGFTFHDSRHTAATMLSRRLDVLDLCRMFGWTDPAQALCYYNPSASSIAAILNTRRHGQPR